MRSRRPRVTRWATAGWLALGLTVAAGCDQESAESEQVREAREALCGATCAAAVRCAESVTSSCESNCMQSSFLLRMTSDALSVQADCLAQTTSCDDGFAELFDGCANEAWLEFPATEASLQTCELLAAPLFECGWFDSLDQCASYFAVFSAPALQSWQSCEGIFDCEALDLCADATLYDYGN